MNNSSENNNISRNPESTPSSEFTSYWGKNNQDPTSAASTTNTASTVSSNYSTTSYPDHSDFYSFQPSQVSEAQEIAARKKKEEEEKNQGPKGVGGAAAIAGIAGLCLVGPLVGVAAAGGAAYVAATNKGVAGSALRASGSAASVVGKGANNFNKKHQVVQKTGRGLATGVGWVSQRLNRNKKGSANPQAAEANLTN